MYFLRLLIRYWLKLEQIQCVGHLDAMLEGNIEPFRIKIMVSLQSGPNLRSKPPLGQFPNRHAECQEDGGVGNARFVVIRQPEKLLGMSPSNALLAAC